MDTLRWNVGDVEIISLVEIDASEVIQSIIPDATPETVKQIRWLSPHFIDEHGNLKGVVQAFVLVTPDQKVVIDTCVGNDKPRIESPGWNQLKTDFIGKLRAIGCPPETITHVLCTHLHFDHVGWNTTLCDDLWLPTFPNAKYLFSRKEYEYWSSHPANEIADDHAGFSDSVQPIVDAGLAELIDENFTLGQHIALIPTPGHTPGHVSVHISSGSMQAIITGDAVHHPCQIAYPEWSTLSDNDQELACISRKRLLQRLSSTGTLMIGSHFSPPTAGFLEVDGNSFRLIS